MAENHSSSSEHAKYMKDHVATYEGFIMGTIIGTLACLYVLLALAAVAFAHWGTLICWLALFVGTVALILDAKIGSGKWTLSIGGLVVFSLITLVSV